MDPDLLNSGLAEYLNSQAEEHIPLREELLTIEAEIAKLRQDVGLLLDLYLEHAFDREALLKRKRKLDLELQKLERRREDVSAVLQREQATQQQIATLREFAVKIRRKLGIAEAEWPVRRQIVELLDLQVMLQSTEGEREVWVTRIVGLDVLMRCPRA